MPCAINFVGFASESDSLETDEDKQSMVPLGYMTCDQASRNASLTLQTGSNTSTPTSTSTSAIPTTSFTRTSAVNSSAAVNSSSSTVCPLAVNPEQSDNPVERVPLMELGWHKLYSGTSLMQTL